VSVGNFRQLHATLVARVAQENLSSTQARVKTVPWVTMHLWHSTMNVSSVAAARLLAKRQVHTFALTALAVDMHQLRA
jgi:hypothetical protein